MILAIHPERPESHPIRKAAELIKAGGVIIYPTDTVYGIGCSIEHKDAIERVYLIKQQRTDKPFSFVCSDLSNISEYAHVSNSAYRFIKHLIPGPYTFILPSARMKQLPKALVSKRKTVGIRVPKSNFVLALVKEVGHPILSTSVSVNGGAMINDPETIAATFKNSVDLILDGGVLHSEPSTVVDLTTDEPTLVRMGAGEISLS